MASSNVASPDSRRHGRGPTLTPGTTVGGRYAIREPIAGASLLGASYVAVDAQGGAQVALRVLDPGVVDSPAEQQRLIEDIERARALEQKNVAQTYGLGDDGQVRYVVYEFVEGQRLREFLERKQAQGKVFSVKAAYNIVAHLCNAVAYAQSALPHGCISADCVWVNTAGRVKITDWGFGRTAVAQPGFAAQLGSGELASVAPELAGGTTPDVASDVFSIGVVLYQLLCGQTPNPRALVPPSRARPGLPREVDTVIARAMSLDAASRYRDPLELKQALFQAMDGSKAEPPSQEDPPAREPSSNPFSGAAQRVQTQHGIPGQQPASSRAPQVMPGAQPKRPGMIQIPTQHGVGPELVRGRIPTPGLHEEDDGDEKWLVQKDKLDFGPFTLAEVKRQIERGDIHGEHVLIDNASGQRKRVQDHPAIAAFYVEASRRLDLKKRADAEAKLERSEKRKSRGLIVGLIVAVLVVGGGVLALMYLRKPQVVEKVVKVREPENLEDALKGITIEFKSTLPPDRPKKKGGGPGVRRAPGAPTDDFDAPTVLGDASQGGGDEQLSQAQIQGVMGANGRALTACIAEERRRNPGLARVDLDFVVQSSGKVSAVKVNGERGTPVAQCMLGKMRGFSFPRYNGPKTVASYGFTLR